MKGPMSVAPFIVLGIAFIAIGATGNRTFVGIGVVFLAVGAAFLARQRRGA